MTRALTLAALVALAGAACSRTLDPCGEGTYRDGNRCVAVRSDAAPPSVGGDDSGGLPSLPDAGGVSPPTDAAARMDASRDLPDAATDASAEAGADASVDASTPDASGDASTPDAGADASCFGQDIADWADFHLSEGLVDSLLDCASFQTVCAPTTCTMGQCLRLHARVTSCEPCVAAEAACVATSCRQACGVGGNDDGCRACACTNGCTTLFGACAGTSLDVCADCSATTCVRASVLPPELIMVIVDGLL